MRVLDIDLDFFVDGIKAGWSIGEGRLDSDEFPAWSLDQTLQFLEERCKLTRPLPGVALEYHHELFWWWRGRISDGRLPAPFTVVHVDAHADLGMGDNGHQYIMTDLLFRNPEDRAEPDEERLTEGNFLAFAAACRWLEDLTYVRNKPFGPPVDYIASKVFGINDLPQHYMKDYDLDAVALQLKAVDPEDFERRYSKADPVLFEPEIPFRYVHFEQWEAEEPFDVVCLTRSPSYTPEESDVLYGEIRARFIDETVWA